MGNRRQSTPGQGSRATGGNLPLGRGLGQQAATYHWAGASGNRRQSPPGQGSRATGGNLPLGRGLGQQAATYHWAGALGNRRQSTPGQGSRATGGNLPWAGARATGCKPTTGQGPRGLNATLAGHWVHGDSTGSDGSSTQGHHRTRVVRAHTAGQFGTRVVGAHSGDSSEHGRSVHTARTVQDTGSQCAQQGQFRTRVVGAHSGGQFRTRVVGAHSGDTQQQTASRDTQPRTVCRVPQQQLPGHSSRQGARVPSRQAYRLAGSQLWGLTFEEEAHAELWRLPTLGYCRGLQS
ncbi:unnamed protein product [Staurois parvus]|uniref:Uncharacterized protein n=1 Tax=Staurois parvus TaxID=386267 RepID=A0ABN9E206_9NEOB|nr:unnamed protein product [Staurois parvus]